MNFISTYQKYFIIIGLSILLGLFRWFLLDRNFPLIAEQQVSLDAFISFQDINRIIKTGNIPIIDKTEDEITLKIISEFEFYSENTQNEQNIEKLAINYHFQISKNESINFTN